MNPSVFYLMHGERRVAKIHKNGKCKIYYKSFMPYNLVLEEREDFDIQLDNINNFYYWCASRVLSLDRKYAKEILNSIGALQASTDRDRANIALSYHCVSLTDIYWVQHKGEKLKYAEINLFENHLSNAFVDVSLRGKQMTIQNSALIANDISTVGCFPKAWLRASDGSFLLLKDGGAEYVENEILASRICQCFSCNQICYKPFTFEGQKVSVSKIITSLQYGTISRQALEIYCANHDLDSMEYILHLDAYGYYMMNILDYLIGNHDRHWENWGLFVDNAKNKPLRLYDLMDFNQAFRAYEDLEGANSLTDPGKTQREAAEYAVSQIGLNRKKPIEKVWFGDQTEKYEMLQKRLSLLEKAEK